MRYAGVAGFLIERAVTMRCDDGLCCRLIVICSRLIVVHKVKNRKNVEVFKEECLGIYLTIRQPYHTSTHVDA